MIPTELIVKLIPIIPRILAIVIIGISLLAGLLSKNGRSLSKIIVILIAGIGAWALSKLLFPLMLDKLMTILTARLSEMGSEDSTISAIISSLGSVEVAVRAIISMVIIPFLFLIVFVVLRLLLGIILTGMFTKLFCATGKIFQKRFHYLGVLLGLVSGCLIVVLLMGPVLGFVKVADQTMVTLEGVVEEEEETSTMAKIQAYTSPVANARATKVISVCGGNLLFKSLSTVKVNKDYTNLSKESKSLSAMVVDVYMIKDTKIEDYGEKESQSIQSLSDSFADSVVVPMLAADIISNLSKAWANGEMFAGIEQPDMGDGFADFTDTLIEVLTTTDYSTVRKDVDCIAFMFCDFIEHGVFKHLDDSAATLEAVSSEGLISGIVTKLYENEHMEPLIPSVTNLGFHLFADMLGIPADSAEVYDRLMGDVAKAVNDAKVGNFDTEDERAIYLKQELGKAYAKNGVAMDDNLSNIIAPALLDYFKDYSSVTKEQVTEFYSELSEALANDQPQDLAAENGFDVPQLLAAETAEDKVILLADKEYFKQLANALKTGNSGDLSFADTYAGILNFYEKPEEGSNSLNQLVNLGSSDTFETAIITADQLMVSSDSGKTATPEEKKANAEGMEKLIATMSGVIKDLDNNSLDTSSLEGVGKLMGTLGSALDTLKDMPMVGKEGTENLLTGVLQSKVVSEATGWTPEDASKVSNNISEALSNEENGYESVMNVMVDSVAYLNAALDENATLEECEENLLKMMQSLTPGSAQAICEIVNENLLTKFGLQPEDAAVVARVIRSLFTNMGNARSNGMSEEEYEKEVRTIHSVVALALSLKESNQTDFFGENGTMTLTADNLISLVVETKIVADTINGICYDDNGQIIINPLGIYYTPNDAETEIFNNALREYKNNHSSTTEVLKTLNALSALVGVQPLF